MPGSRTGRDPAPPEKPTRNRERPNRHGKPHAHVCFAPHAWEQNLLLWPGVLVPFTLFLPNTISGGQIPPPPLGNFSTQKAAQPTWLNFSKCIRWLWAPQILQLNGYEAVLTQLCALARVLRHARAPECLCPISAAPDPETHGQGLPPPRHAGWKIPARPKPSLGRAP